MQVERGKYDHQQHPSSFGIAHRALIRQLHGAKIILGV
jgi:hypothetical protein